MESNKIHFGFLVMSLGTVVIGLLGDLKAKVVNLEEQLLFLEREKLRLESDGLIYAAEYWRGDKYMYLNYPTAKGEKRKRVYVGADPVKIDKAKKGIMRANEYDLLVQNMNEINDIYSKVSFLLQESSRHLDKKL